MREREAIRETARRFLAHAWPAGDAVARSASPVTRREAWRAIAAQGWLALGLEPELGGMGVATLLLEELGRAACPVPLLDAVIANVLLAGNDTPSRVPHDLLARLHAGDASLSIAAADAEGNASSGSVRFENGQLNGTAAFVEGAEDATDFLVCTNRSDEIVLVRADSRTVGVVVTPGLARPSLSEVTFEDAGATSIPVRADCRNALRALARLGLTARALGAAARGFEMIVDYARIRTQFGEPIGRYQAIQHKLANCLMALEVVRLSVVRAAGAFDSGNRDWEYASAAAFAFASPALRQVCLETHHAFGGVSFWEEHEMPRHFRRIHSDLTRYGGVHGAREDVARALMAQPA